MVFDLTLEFAQDLDLDLGNTSLYVRSWQSIALRKHISYGKHLLALGFDVFCIFETVKLLQDVYCNERKP